MKNKLFAAWLCLILAFSAFVMTSDTSDNVEGKEFVETEVTYIASEPFRINNNTDFATSSKVTTGDGSVGNPWIIENFEINGTGFGYCIYIGNTTDNFVVMDCKLQNASGGFEWAIFGNQGICLASVQNGMLTNNTIISNEGGGIYLLESSGINMSNNTMIDNGIVIEGFVYEYWDTHTIDSTNTVNGKPVRYYKVGGGITVPSDSGQIILARCIMMVIENQNITNASVGIALGFSSYNIIHNNTLSACNKGIYLQQSSGNDITNNSVMNNDNGLSITYDSNNNNIANNTVTSNTEKGIYLAQQSNNNTIANNDISGNFNGLELQNTNHMKIVDNILINNSGDGILIQDSYMNQIKYNNVYNNGKSGIVLSGQDNQIINNNANNNSYSGIELYGDSNNILENNTVIGNQYGISLKNSQFTHVNQNNILDNYIGFLVTNAHYDVIFNNKVNNSQCGIILDSSTNIYFGGNAILNSTGMAGNSACTSSETNLDVFQNDPNWSSYRSFEEQLATGGGGNPLFTRAIDLADTMVFEVNISGHTNTPDLDLGIFLDGKGGNPVDGITQTGEFMTCCADADADESVRLLAPENGTYLIRVFGFTVSANPGQFDMGINIVNGSSTGIFMLNSNSNKIINCNISNNYQSLNLTQSSNSNRMYYNNIGDNIVQAYDDGINFWNASYSTGGNFWSDYAGTDTFSGPGQDIAGSDGIGDTSYTNILGGGNEDAYPLMEYTDGIYTDNTPPSSWAYIEESYIFPEFGSGFCIISASASDDYSGVAGAIMWYRYSPDYQTWGAWTEFTFYSPNTPFWTFDPVMMGLGSEGHYQFYTIATDYAGNMETKSQAPEAYWHFDVTAPQSHVLQPSGYWNVPDLGMNVHVTDNTNSTSNVEVFYRFSSDNATWGDWAMYENLTSDPWNFTFDFPDGQGHYQFYSRANDTSGNQENATAAAQARVSYDITAPEISDSSPATGTTGDAYTFLAQVTDNVALGEVHVVYRFGTGTEANATMTHTSTGNYERGITLPGSSLDMLHYRIVIVDEAGNWNSTGSRNVLITDNDAPIANAGPDRAVDAGSLIRFNASASTDNIGIVNFTWAFNDGMGNVTLYGVSPAHNFTVPGNYTVTLIVRDAGGNTGTDAMVVRVSAIPPEVDTTPPEADAGPDQNVTAGTLVTFTGADSTDNVGITNYTWTLTYNGTDITLYDISPTFRFWMPGNYTVSLTVRDVAGNIDTDTVLISINPINDADDVDGSFGNYIWIILIVVIVLTLGTLLSLKMAKGKKPVAPKTEEAVTEKSIKDDLANEQSTEAPKNE